MSDPQSDANAKKPRASKGRFAAIAGAVAAVAVFVANVDKISDTVSGWIAGKKDQTPTIVVHITTETLLKAAGELAAVAKGASGTAKVETEQAARSLSVAAANLPAPISLNTAAKKVPTWLQVAMQEVGQEEIPGPEHNPRILEYIRSASAGATSHGDELPWTSFFVNWALAQSGVPGTNNGAARSWLTWGTALESPHAGAIVVFERPGGPPGTGHVGFYLGDAGDQVLCISGNVGNAVRMSAFPKSRVLGYRWPKDT